MIKLCKLCATFLEPTEIENCRDGLCKDCCQSSYLVDGEMCDNSSCPHYECQSRKMENIDNLFNEENADEN